MKIDGSVIKERILNFIVPLVSLGITFVLGFLVLYPSFRALPKLKEEATQKQTLDATLTSKLSNLNKLLDYKSVVDEDSSLVQKVLVEEAEVPELLTQVDLVASESGMDIQKLNYSFSNLGTAPTGAAGAAPATSTEYKSVNVSMNALGTIDQLKTFLSRMENSARMINVESFRYSIDENEGATRLSVSFDLVSPYLFVESSAVTDDAVALDITGAEFLGMMDRVKNMKFYNVTTDSINMELVIESSASAEPQPEVEEEPISQQTGGNPFGDLP